MTIAKLRDVAFNAIAEAIRDEGNWASMFSYFPYERALSEYLARFPQKIEGGLTTHPHTKKLLPNGKLVDVLLMDKDGTPVVVECKRDSVTAADIDQLEGYVDEMKRETGKSHVRGILIHGGARVLSENLTRKLQGLKHLRVFQYQLDVNFNLCQ